MASQRPALPQGYEYIGPLGAGGFGEVVLARHRMIGRLVAVKRIHEHALADVEALDRFRREATVLAATTCASVVKVYDLVTGEGGAQLVMEYCPGQSLADVLELGPLPASEALVILRDVAEALGAMAKRGIIHRDIKPGNVFVLPDGHAKLGDFGLARALSDPSAFRTAGGPPMGTPAYFPPEVSKGSGEPDERSDAYSFAVMAFEVLTGRRPFEAPDALSLITAHWTKEPMRAEAAMPGFPARAGRILLSGMDRNPAGRILPNEMVSQLSALHEADWPAVRRRSATAALPRRSDPTVHRPGFTPGDPAENGPASAVRPSRWLRVRWPFVAPIVVGLAAAGLAWGLHASRDPGLQVTSVSVEVDPASGTAACPRGRFVFTAVLKTNGVPGTLRVQWAQPDGETTRIVEVGVVAGQHEVRAKLPFTMVGTTPLEGDVEVRVLSPQVTSARTAMRYTCSGR